MINSSMQTRKDEKIYEIKESQNYLPATDDQPGPVQLNVENYEEDPDQNE